MLKGGFGGILGVAAPLLLVAFVSGCTTTQTPGEQIDDAAIEAAVKAELTANRFSTIVNVEVNVINGIVTLAGEVPNAQVKSDAETAARSVNGVKGVNNNLRVLVPPGGQRACSRAICDCAHPGKCEPACYCE